MANRPIFVPTTYFPYVQEVSLEFEWFPGFSKSQKQKSINSLHRTAIMNELCNAPLEISSKSDKDIGVALSAFNLSVKLGNEALTKLENVFQASKVFEKGGPYRDLLFTSPLEAKRDPRLKESGDLTGFTSRGKDEIWPIEPKTLFYDWIYLNALSRHEELAHQCTKFDGFTDIEFNPKKSFNCQARSAALFVALHREGLLEKLLSDPTTFQDVLGVPVQREKQQIEIQKNLV